MKEFVIMVCDGSLVSGDHLNDNGANLDDGSTAEHVIHTDAMMTWH